MVPLQPFLSSTTVHLSGQSNSSLQPSCPITPSWACLHSHSPFACRQTAVHPTVQAVLAAAVRLPLLAPEAALLHSRAGDHTAALTALALPPAQLVEGAIAYARCLGSPDSWLTLLELFLRPPAETEHDSSSSGHSNRDSSMSSVRQPDYAAACRVINAEGACLNPQRLLAALPPDMPLSLVGGLLGLVVAGLQHRRRYASVVRWA